MSKAKSDGSTASYYELPPNATELQHLIAYKNMNAQMGEIFRANYRYGEVSHSDKMREINKIIFYAQAEKERLLKYEYQGDVEESKELPQVPEQEGKVERILRESQEQHQREHEAAASKSESTYAERAREEARRKRELTQSDTPQLHKEFEEKHNG